MIRIALITILSLFFGLTPCFGVDLEPDQEKEAVKIFQDVLSPFCPGRALQDCPSAAAGELKNDIRGKLAKGQPREQVMQSLFKEYGDQISAVPQTRGVGLLAWLAPFVFFWVGFGVLVVWLRKGRKKSAPTRDDQDTMGADR